MRLVHTADWHLGRILYGVHLTEDQSHVLDQFVAFVKDAKPDAVLLAGDVYDRAVPPPEAVALLDDTLARLVLDAKTPVVVAAGNHDSPERLEFGSRLLAPQGLHVAGRIGPASCRVPFATKTGPATVYALPYAEPPFVREALGDEAIRDHDAALRALVGRIEHDSAGDGIAVLMAHCFVAGGEESESERPLSVGGAGSVGADAFDGFDYVALGHLHRPQRAGGDSLRYSGSLMKYAFAEAGHKKGVLLAELEAGQPPQVEQVSFTPRRDLRCLSGTIDTLVAAAPSDAAREDYLSVTLEDEGPVLDAMGRLRKAYPNVLHIERASLGAPGTWEAAERHEGLSEMDLFDAFFRQVEDKPLSPAQREAFAGTVEAMDRGAREAQP